MSREKNLDRIYLGTDRTTARLERLAEQRRLEKIKTRLHKKMEVVAVNKKTEQSPQASSS